MSIPRRVFIAGGAHTPYIGKHHPDFIWKRHPDFGQRENPTYDALLREAVENTIKDTGVDPEQIDRLYVGNFTGELFINQGHMGAALAGAHPALAYKPSARLEGACASGGLAMMAGIDAIAAGADIVLISGVEVQTTVSARQGADYLARASDYARQRSIDDFTFPAMFARRIKHLLAETDAREEDLGHVSVKAYDNANKNPFAHMKARKMTLEVAASANDKNPNFLSNPELSPYLKVSDCSQVSDGATVLLLVSEDGLKKLGRTITDTVEIVGRGQSVDNLFIDRDPLELATAKDAVGKAYLDAGLGIADIDVAEVHDCFTVAEVLMYEAIGLADKGQGYTLAREGVTRIDGKLPVNTGGGLIGFGHPVGATGVKQPLEIFRQMKGRAGDYQVAGDLNHGLTVNMGGDDKTVVSMVLKNHS
ncbi:MAG: thiolase domain-containing protein [Myxococcota bacterium]